MPRIIALWIAYKPKSPNRIQGVKDKIAQWKAARDAVDFAFNSYAFDGGFLTHTTISQCASSQLSTESLSDSDSTTTQTHSCSGVTAKPEPWDTKEW